MWIGVVVFIIYFAAAAASIAANRTTTEGYKIVETTCGCALCVGFSAVCIRFL